MSKDNLFNFIQFLTMYYHNKEEIDIDNSDLENYINYFCYKFTMKEYILYSEYLKVINREFGYEK